MTDVWVKKREYRRWTAAESREILEYLKNNSKFERPIAQTYYTEFLKNSQIQVSWTLIRFKVRHLRRSYAKAIAWSRSVAARHLDKRSTRAKILVICPFYDILHEIFGNPCWECSKIDDTVTANHDENTNCVVREDEDDNEAFDESLDTPETNADSDLIDNVKPNVVVKVENESFEAYDSSATNHIELNCIVKEEYGEINDEDTAEFQHSTTPPPTSATDCCVSPTPEHAPEPTTQPSLNHNIPIAKNNQGAETEETHSVAASDNDCKSSKKSKKPLKTALETLTTLQKQRREMQSERLQFEYKKLKFEKRKLRLEEKKLKLTSEWQQKAFELQKLELQLKYNTKKK